MRITYDKKADALNIILKRGRVSRTIEAAPEVFIDFDSRGNPLYLEIIGASEKIGKKSFSELEFGKKLIKLPAFSAR